MAQSVSLQSSSSETRLLFGFIAGFVATLIFHQIGLLLLHFVGMTPNMPYNMNLVPPFGVPQFMSLSFWGGVYDVAGGRGAASHFSHAQRDLLASRSQRFNNDGK